MKKILPLSLLAMSSLVYADFSTQQFLYKDARIMGMGSTNVATGGYSTSLFYNPAGIINIKEEHGVEFELLGLSVSGSEDIKNFMDDLNDVETDVEAIDVVKKYSGDTFNVTASNYTSVSKHSDDFAYSVGLLVGADANFIPHANSGSNGLIETHSRAYGGVMVGFAQDFPNILGGTLSVGLGVKYITQQSYEAGLDTGEVVAHSDDLVTYIQDTYEVENSGFGVDLGLIYKPSILPTLKPSVGLSIMNIGTLNFDDVYGSQPMTINMGFAISPEVSYIDSFKISVDYVDMLNTQQARIRNYNPYRSNDQYDDVDISFDVMQHLRAGMSVGLFDNSWVMMTLNGGLYEGAYTAGLDLQFAIVKLEVATYQEQLGAEIGQLEDRRYMLGVGIGW